MGDDLKESLMMIANKKMTEYEVLRATSTENFLVKYKIFIDDIVDKIEARQAAK
jgi:hypothetical protein